MSYRGRGRGSGRGGHSGIKKPYSSGEHGSSSGDKETTRVELRIMGANPSTSQVNNFQDALCEWAGENTKHRMYRIADRKNPGDIPEAEEPEQPDRDGDGYATPEIDEDLTAAENNRQKRRNAEAFARDHKEYTVLMAIFRKKQEEIDHDATKMFMHMKTHLSLEARSKLTDKIPDCFANECPRTLMEAIRLTFLGPSTGVLGNRISVENARGRFNKLKQFPDQATSKFIEVHRSELQVLMKLELDAGTTQLELDVIWSERRQIDHFIERLCPIRFNEWKDKMQFDSENHPTPTTLDAAVRQTVVREEQFRSKQKWMIERANTFLTQGRGGRGGRGAGKRDDNKGTAHKDDQPRDAKGRLTCHAHNSAKGCGFGAEKCRYSHYPPVGASKGKPKDEVDDMIDKAKKHVGFVDPDDSKAGGGPDPAKWGSKN